MSDVPVLSARRSGVGYLTLNRATKGNALSADVVQSLSDGIDDHLGHGARMLVFQGEGRHLCTGFDLSNLGEQSDADLLFRFVNIELLLQKIYSAPVITVAIGRGRVFGAGADLFAACHRRLALAGSAYSFPGAAFGIILGTRRLAERVGFDRAQKTLIDGLSLTDGDALKFGLANEIIAEDAVEAALAELSSAAVRLDEQTVASILGITTSRSDEEDLSKLVRSAARPGLAHRIATYREKVRSTTSR